MPKIRTDILIAALESLTSKRAQIDEQLAEIRQMLGEKFDSPVAAAAKPAKKKHHHISGAGRRAIALAQKRRWKAQKAAVLDGVRRAENSGKPAKKKKRKLSVAGRAAIVAALKKRWAAAKAKVA